MARAIWDDVVLAESDLCVIVEGNHYFPPGSVRRDLLKPSGTTTVCPWKGVAGYYDVVVGERINRDAAWFYEEPKPAAREIANHVAFWRGVRVEP